MFVIPEKSKRSNFIAEIVRKDKYFLEILKLILKRL